jgi:hypothetical protein
MQLSAIRALVTQRLGEASTATYYPTAEITSAINEGYRFFVLLTLGLEKTSAWTTTAATTFFRMLTIFPDWIVPLQIVNSSGVKIRPCRLEELSALDDGWISSAGTLSRYASLGVDLLALYKQPAGQVTLQVTYCYNPPLLVSDADTPLIPSEYHPSLAKYAIYRLRQVEGLEEFGKTLPLFDDFLAAATKYGNWVRARNIAGRYDKIPIELEKFDRSKLLKLRSDLVPQRKVKT